MQVNENLIEKFIKSADWESIWDEDTFCQENVYPVEHYLDEDDFNWECGATKMVILPVDPNEQFVIKIPFRYLYTDSDNPIYINEKIVCVPVSEECQIVDYFGWLLNEGYESDMKDFQEETKKYCEIPYPIYLQEMCETSIYQPCGNYDEREEIRNQIIAQTQSEKIANCCYNFVSHWIVSAIKAYGLEKLIELFQFMVKYKMTDFHDGNYGYRKSDGTPVLIDFAGFYEE